MDTALFHQYAAELMANIENFIDRYIATTDEDIDYECQGNVLTITLANHNKIIINTQEPLAQIWIATHQQGYHFNYRDHNWYCERSQQEIMELLTLALQHQA